MIPIGDDNPTLRTPYVTYAILAGMLGAWVLVQGAGFDFVTLAGSACNLGLVPGELTGQAPLGQAVPLGPGLACAVDDDPINMLTPVTSMFLHGSWAHLLGNALFFWVFGNNVEDSMGHGRFALFYLICGLAAAGTHVMLEPASPVPTVGASGAISGIMGAYLVLYPRVDPEISGGVAVWAHVGGFVAGVLLIKLFEDRRIVALREAERHRLHPGHP